MLQTVNIHRTDDELDAITEVKSFWKKFTILDAFSIVDESWKEIKEETLNSC